MFQTDSRKSRTLSKRENLLRAGGVEFGSPAERELFWRRYNHKRKRVNADIAKLGEVIGPWLSRQTDGGVDQLASATRLWMRMIPQESRDRVRVEGISRKRLRVVVDSKATAFLLKRRSEANFLAAAAAELGGTIEGVTLRVGRIPNPA